MPLIPGILASGISGHLVTAPSSVNYIIVASGGVGGFTPCGSGISGGGGGAGGLRSGTTSVTAGSPYTIVVHGGNPGYCGTTGYCASAFGITSTGGGAGMKYPTAKSSVNNGGSGGGGVNGVSGVGCGITGQGYKGGASASGASGGGGGAGAIGCAGVHTIPNRSGNGGVGLSFTYGTSAVYFAGGGGGGSSSCSTPGCGGSGGGGKGGQVTTGVAGTVNTGGGGGGGGYSASCSGSCGGTGGSGVVVIYYANTYADAASTTGSPVYANAGGYKSYKFNGSGSITF